MKREPPSSKTTTATEPGERRRLEVVRRLVVHRGGGEPPRVVVLDGKPVVIGRDSDVATLVLHDQQLSRQHARIARDEAGAWTVTDLGSRNGTHVDGARCDRAPLRNGAVIRVGRSLIVYSEESGDPASLVAEAAPLFGPSAAMARVRGEIERVAPTAIPVLVLGETGVGKELAASAIHARSGRSGPLVPVNCAALAAGLAEAELFGHEAGAFTGAAERREGLIAAAAGGTLFLDEIGEMPLALQPKLLRALALGEVRPVGSSKQRRLDVRVVAATNCDLAAAEGAGTFRGDLLARLSGWTLRIPPLRERREDILPLATRFLRDRRGGPELSPGAAEALLLHDYPHNVRELHHELEAALARWDGHGPLGCEHLPKALAARVLARENASEAPAPPAATPATARPSAEELGRVLRQFGGNVARVAAFYKRDRHQVYRWIEHHGLDVASFRKE